jgi:hypothetical protein
MIQLTAKILACKSKLILARQRGLEIKVQFLNINRGF